MLDHHAVVLVATATLQLATSPQALSRWIAAEMVGCRALQTAPGITPALVERLVASRQDLNKADIKEVRSRARRRVRALRATVLDVMPQLVVC